MLIYIYTGPDSVRLGKENRGRKKKTPEWAAKPKNYHSSHKIVIHSTYNQPEWRDLAQYWGNSLEISEKPCLKNMAT